MVTILNPKIRLHIQAAIFEDVSDFFFILTLFRLPIIASFFQGHD